MEITNAVYEKSKDVTVMSPFLKDNNYICRSKGSKNEWNVVSENGIYYCDCPAFSKNKSYCKHTVAVMTYNNIKYTVEEEKVLPKKTGKTTGSTTGSTSGPTSISFGFDRYEVISTFHKSLRKGDVERSWYFLEVMIQSNIGVWYLNNYIGSIIAEELCICDPDLVTGLKSYLNPMAKSYDNYMLYGAVDIFCSSKKFWECDRCWQRKVANAKNIQNIKTENKPRFDIPHYALDRHTLRGKMLPENEVDWRYAGTWFSMYWRRKCTEQGLDINTAKWEDVKLSREEKEEFEFFKTLGVK